MPGRPVLWLLVAYRRAELDIDDVRQTTEDADKALSSVV